MFRLFLLALLLPSLAQAAEVRFSEPDAAITIHGTILEGDDAKFEALLSPDVHKVVIRSDGGRQPPALAIAREVHARRMTVIVDGFCASACAQIIFPAAAERRIRPDAFVAFHGGNMAARQAVRAELARETALMQASGEGEGAAAAKARRDAIVQFLAGTEAKIDAADARQAEFDMQMKLDPEVVEFYLKLTAPRDIRVELHPGDASPVRVAVGQPGICDWWVPDREGLAKLGLDLRNGYDVPSPEAIAALARTTPARLYFGPPVAVDDPHFDTLCPAP